MKSPIKTIHDPLFTNSYTIAALPQFHCVITTNVKPLNSYCDCSSIAIRTGLFQTHFCSSLLCKSLFMYSSTDCSVSLDPPNAAKKRRTVANTKKNNPIHSQVDITNQPPNPQTLPFLLKRL